VVYLEDSLTVWQFADEKPQDQLIRERLGQVKSGGGVADPAAISHQNHTRNFKAFIDVLQGGDSFSISGEQARKSVEVILAIYESARQQKPVKLS